MRKVKVSCMGILLFSSTKYIPSDNPTLCDAAALAAVAKRRKKPNQTTTHTHIKIQKEPPDHSVP